MNYFETRVLEIFKQVEEENKLLFVICPTDGFYLNKTQFHNILVKLIELTQSSKVFIEDCEFEKTLEVEGSLGFELRVYRKSEFDYGKYHETLLLFDNRIYSDNEQWSINVFQDSFLLLSLNKDIFNSNEFDYDFEEDYKYFEKYVNNSIITDESYRIVLQSILKKLS